MSPESGRGLPGPVIGCGLSARRKQFQAVRQSLRLSGEEESGVENFNIRRLVNG